MHGAVLAGAEGVLGAFFQKQIKSQNGLILNPAIDLLFVFNECIVFGSR
jgi:hypothetical protein